MAFFGLVIYAGYRAIDLFLPAWANAFASQHSDMKRAIASYAKLDEVLARLGKDYHASRSILFRFHDASRDASQMAFYFVTMANAVGVAIDQEKLKDLPASTFVSVLPTLVKGGIYFSWTKDMPDSPLKELQVSRGTRAVLYAPMPDLDHNLIGILSLEWLSESDVSVITDEMKADLTAKATLISGYFSLPQLKDIP